MKVSCPTCKKTAQVPEMAGGKKARCPACQTVFIVPTLNPDPIQMALPIEEVIPLAEGQSRRRHRATQSAFPWKPVLYVGGGILGVFLLCCGVSTVFRVFFPDYLKEMERKAKAERKVISVSITQLVKESDGDWFAMHEKYKGKYVSIGGKILKHGGNAPSPHLVIWNGEKAVICQFPASERSSIQNLQLDQHVAIIGQVFISNNLFFLQSCELVPD